MLDLDECCVPLFLPLDPRKLRNRDQRRLAAFIGEYKPLQPIRIENGVKYYPAGYASGAEPWVGRGDA